jgi:hypothetical protein
MVVLRQQQVSLVFRGFSYHGRERDIHVISGRQRFWAYFWIALDSNPRLLITTPTPPRQEWDAYCDFDNPSIDSFVI